MRATHQVCILSIAAFESIVTVVTLLISNQTLGGNEVVCVVVNLFSNKSSSPSISSVVLRIESAALLAALKTVSSYSCTPEPSYRGLNGSKAGAGNLSSNAKAPNRPSSPLRIPSLE